MSRRRGKLIVLLALSVASVLAFTPGRADVPVGIHGSETTTLPAVALTAPGLLPQCSLGTDWNFSGFRRPNNTIYGTLTWYSDISCNKKMVYLLTNSNMRKAPNTPYFSGGPNVCGVDKPAATGSCTYLRKNGSAFCDPCNGTYTMDAVWQLRWPAAYSYLPYATSDARIVCTRTLNGKFTCNGHGLDPGSIS